MGIYCKEYPTNTNQWKVKHEISQSDIKYHKLRLYFMVIRLHCTCC